MATPEERYAAAAHAMQSGVATDHGLGSKDGSPKHLRVGINSCMVTDAALAELLIANGVFTKEEYVEAVATAMENEAERYRQILAAKLGTNVTLA